MERRQSYEHQEAAPHGEWVTLQDWPTPRRTDRGFKVGAAASGIAIVLAALCFATYGTLKTGDMIGAWPVLALGFGLAALVYGFVRAVGLIVVGLVSMATNGPEFIVNWRNLAHDLRLRATWAQLLELALLLATLAMMFFSLRSAIYDRSVYSALVFVLLGCMTWWPFIRHRIKFGRWHS